MRKHIGLVVLATLVVAVLLIYTISYTVKSTEKTFVMRFGKVLDETVHDGAEPGEAGLKFKMLWPIESLVRYDGRIFMLEDPTGELQTSDKQNILVTMFCAWRIKDQVQFHSRIGTIAKAESTIRSLLHAKKSSVVSQHPISEFVNTNPQAMKLPQIEQEVLKALREEVEDEYGVEVVMVGIKSLGLPEDVTETVIETMKAEREQEAEDLRQRGASQAAAIRAAADDSSNRILAFAERKAAEIRAEGYHEASEYYAEFAEDPQFGMFLRSLESLEKELTNRTIFLLDGSELPAVNYFREGPSLPEGTPGR